MGGCCPAPYLHSTYGTKNVCSFTASPAMNVMNQVTRPLTAAITPAQPDICCNIGQHIYTRLTCGANLTESREQVEI